MFRWVPAPPFELVKPLLRPSLTHLCIHRLHDPLSVQDCLEVLRMLRQLEDLALGDVLRRPDEVPSVNPPSEDDLLDLPCLNRIALEGNCLWINGRDSYREYHDTGVAAADLLRHLIIPSTADIFVAVGHERYNEADEGETLAFAFDILKDVAAGKIVATLGSGRQAITSCYAEAYPLSEEIYTTDHFFELLIDLPGGDQSTNVLGSPSGIVWPRRPGQGGSMRCRVRSDCDVLGKSVHDIFARLKPVLSDVRLLHWNRNLRRLGVSGEGRHGIWEGLLVNMSEVQDLVIDGSAAHWVDWMLEKYPGWVYEDVRPVLPCLRTLAVDGAEANWSPGYIYSWQSPNEYTRRHVYYCDRADLTGVLLGALQDWSEWHGGRKLEKLMITNTDCVSEEDMREIISSGFTSSVQCSFMESESEKDEEEDVAEDQTSDI
ncbi:hypothetical protein BC629DRAFT_1502245 [Irpex lacteus]|nr:hypothetical protein BC629DRAFT_1502245 [Irpex lacteus]